MEIIFEIIKGFIDVNIIIGDFIKIDIIVVVFILKVIIGFGIGGGEYLKGYDDKDREIELKNEKLDMNFVGGSVGVIFV